MRTAVGTNADRELVGEVPNGLLRRHTESQVRQLVRSESRCCLEVPDLFALGAEPSEAAIGEHSIEHHQPFDRASQRRWPSVPVIGFAHSDVERLSLNVVQPGTSVRRRVWSSELLSDQG